MATDGTIVGRVLREGSDELLGGDLARLDLAASAEARELPSQESCIGIIGGGATTPTEKAMR
jgi:hypothetical protein